METYKDNMSYEQLILYHLRDISRLSVVIQGDMVNDRGLTIHYKNDDKELALAWSVAILESLIPNNIKDETFTREKTYIKTLYANTASFKYNKGLLQACINLLSRKGLLSIFVKKKGTFIQEGQPID